MLCGGDDWCVARLLLTVVFVLSVCCVYMLMKPDEVESLTAARSGAANGTEPSDALRVGRCEAG
jgi:hypothetical protein